MLAVMSDHVFTYGTLMFPAVWAQVVGRACSPTAARVHGFERRAIRGAPYPAVVAEADAPPLTGVLHRDLTRDELARLDRYEGPLYRRCRTPVELRDGGSVDAWLYVLAPGEQGRLAEAPWDPERFRREALAAYLADAASS